MNVLSTNKLIDLSLLQVFKGEVVKVINAGDKAITDKLGTLPEKVGETSISTFLGYVDAKIAQVNGAASTLEGRVGANEAAITKLNANSETVGSVDYKIAQAFDAFINDESNDNTVNTYKELIAYVAAHKTEYTNLAALVGTLPAGAVATTIVGYIKEYADSLAGNYDPAGKAAELIGALGGEKSGSQNGVSVTVKTVAGQVSEVSVVAPDFANTYDTINAAANVQGSTTETVASVNAKAEALTMASEAEVLALFA